ERASVRDEVSAANPPYPAEALLTIPRAAVTPPRRTDYVTADERLRPKEFAAYLKKQAEKKSP
ncbi:MAG TPA: hypothetical protein VKA46_10390, partial [Gemmataceae bacterium]|nr:hypothetical protein [Gemmataceae bacterium]